jgi:putative hemolysin
MRQNPERTLSVLQVGITLVGIVSAAAGGAGAQESLAPVLSGTLGLSENLAEALAIAVVVIPLTLLNVVFGELIPKSIALRSPLTVSRYGVQWVVLLDRFFAPIVWFLEKFTRAVLRLLPKSRSSHNVGQIATVDIDHLSHQTQQYVLNLVAIEQRQIKDVMIPWKDVDHLDTAATRDDAAALAVRSGHTRLPVIHQEHVVGLLHTKEFIATLASGLTDWQSIIRPAIVVGPNRSALRTLREMQVKKSHMAIVLQEERPIGIVTFEDIIEEIVGELNDEDDDGMIRKLLRRHHPWWKS